MVLEAGGSGLELIHIVPEKNRGGFGFTLTGNRTMGVFVKSVLGGSIVDKDGRLAVGDQLLKCDDISFLGLGAEQAIRIIRVHLSLTSQIAILVAHASARSRGHAFRPTTSYIKSSLSLSNLRPSESPIEEEVEVHASPRRSLTQELLFSVPEIPPPGNIDAQPQPKPKIRSITPSGKSPAPSLAKEEEERRTESSRASKGNFVGKRTVRTVRAKVEPEPQPTTRLPRFSPKRFSKEDSDDVHSFLGSSLASPTHSPKPRKGFSKPRQAGIGKSDSFQLSNLNRRVSKKDDVEIYKVDGGDTRSESTNSNGSINIHWQCPICFDGPKRISATHRRLMSTSCGHVFCSDCVGDIVEKHGGLCPSCRSIIKPHQLHPIYI